MAQVHITYDLPEETEEILSVLTEVQDMLEEFDAVRTGWKWKGVLQDLDEWLKGQIKHADREELEEVRDKLYEKLADHGLLLWD